MADLKFQEQPWSSHHWSTNDGKPDGGASYGVGFCISWQRGSLSENGRNGAFLTEVLSATIDELEHKNKYFPCAENLQALENLKAGLEVLNKRLERRYSEGVFGTHQPDSQDIKPY